MGTEEELAARIAAAGDKVRDLKAVKDADNAAAIKEAVAQLLALKTEFKEVTGKDFGPPPSGKKKKTQKKQKEEEENEAKDTTPEQLEGPKDPAKKSKKELNKERKKAHKLAVKTGTVDDIVPAATSAAATSAVATSAAATSKKTLKKAVYAGIELPAPSAEDDGVIVFSSAGPLPRASFVVAQLMQYTPGFRNFGRDAARAALVPTLTLVDGRLVSGDFAIARYLARLKPELGLYGAALKDAAVTETALLLSQIDAWLDFALTRVGASVDDDSGLQILDRVLKMQTFVVGHALSLADIGLWAQLSPLQKELDLSVYPNVARWLAHLEAQQAVFAKVDSTLKAMHAPAPVGAVKKLKDSGSCPPLEDAVDGQVVTRFPPEPSGYLHIGHIKACMLNNYYARHYHGKLIVRFDDTNPSKEKEEFEQSIIADLKRVGVVPDVVTYTSDYFPKIADFARQMIREGNAYMDNTPQEQMREERMDGLNSKCRDQTPELNLVLFEKMLKNEPEAQGYCLRGKIDMQAKNKTMRDPVFFRSNPTPHHRTGTKYPAYPTYDLACPIVDSLEGVTHALRTTEYNDRDFQYQWVLDTLCLRKVIIQSFARMNFVYSVLSKRKLQWFVDNGHVEGWTDPRFPTVQGVLRRGVQVEALRDFILSQGASRRITDMEWDKFWTLNKRVLDPTAPRYFAVAKESSVQLLLTNVEDKVIGIPVGRHPKDPSMGIKMVRFSSKLLLERDDVANFVEGEEVTLMRHGNIIIKKVNKAADGTISSVEAENYPEGDFTKTKLKVTWLADVPDLVPLVLVEFDHLLNKAKLEEGDNFQDYLTTTTRAEMHALGDHELRNIKEGQVVQLERRGYFRVDVPYMSDDKPVVMFMVPDGKVKAMSTLSTKLAHRSRSSKRRAFIPLYATDPLSKDISDNCRRLLPLVSRELHSLRRPAIPTSFLLPKLQQGSATIRWHGHSHGCLLDQEESEEQRALRQQVSAGDMKAADRITWVGVWLNVVLSGLKGAAGVAFHSSGLLADATHSIGDLVSDFVTLVSLKYCARPPDALQPYGYGKYETVGALSVSLLLVGGSLGIMAHSLDSLLMLLEPVSASVTVTNTTQVVELIEHMKVETMEGVKSLAKSGHTHAHGLEMHPAALGIAALSVVAKEALFRTTFSIGHRVHSSVLIANAWHHRSDAVTSVVALSGIGLSLAGFPLFDPLAGIAVGTIILKMGAQMGWNRMKELCDVKLPDRITQRLEKAVDSVIKASGNEIVGVRKLRSRKVGRHVNVDLTLLVDEGSTLPRAVEWKQQVKNAIVQKVPQVKDIVVEVATTTRLATSTGDMDMSRPSRV